MFPVGLAALDQGYYGAAPSYWKARELEDTNAAYNLLGQTFMQMAGQGQPTGWGNQPGAGMLPGGQPLPPSGMPPGGLPGAPAGMPRPGMMPPTTPQGTLGSVIPSPAAGPAAIPQPGGLPPAQAPAPTAPGVPPPGAGPPPTASPGMGGAGGFQQPPPAITQSLGPAPYDWRQVAQTIAQANPGASPAVIARAVTMMMPFMQQDSQNQWRQIQYYMREQELSLREQQLGETRRSHEANEAGRAIGREETERAHREAERQRDERIRQSDRRVQNTEAWRAQEAARKDVMAAATLDKQDFDRKFQIWKQKYTVMDRNERARIQADANLSPKDKKAELERLDAQRGAAERDMEEFATQLPEKRAVPQRGAKPTAQQRVNEGFGGVGEGKPQPVSPQQQADFRKLIESGEYTQDQIIQYLQRNNLDASWLAK